MTNIEKIDALMAKRRPVANDLHLIDDEIARILKVDSNRIAELNAMSYDDYLKTPEWLWVRHWVIKFWGFCVLCRKGPPLDVHHNCYRRGCERFEDLVPLCAECHQLVDAHKPMVKALGPLLRALESRGGSLDDAWRTLAEDIRRHASIDKFHNGTLFVVVDLTVWLEEIVRFRRKEIIDHLRSKGVKVEKISYYLKTPEEKGA